MRPDPAFGETPSPDVSIVLPCLNQARLLPYAIANARAALVGLDRELGLSGEIILADAGSRDGSQMVAIAEAVHVVDVPSGGYGAALNNGLAAARGRYLVMGDIDGSCDFRDCVPMLRALMRGVDLCVGSRVLAKQQSGWSRLFNPLLSLLLRLFFGVVLSDATCRLRALSASSFRSLRLQARGVEYTTEMIIKAALLGYRMTEAPSHSPRGGRAKKMRRAGLTLRHLGYVGLLCPAWVFLVPALVLIAAGAAVWVQSLLGTRWILPAVVPGWGYVIAGALICMGHFLCLFALGAHLYACREGFHRAAGTVRWVRAPMTINGQLGLAGGLGTTGCLLMALPFAVEMQLALAFVGAASLLILALQSVFAAFLVAILKGADGEVAESASTPHPVPQPVRLSL